MLNFFHTSIKIKKGAQNSKFPKSIGFSWKSQCYLIYCVDVRIFECYYFESNLIPLSLSSTLVYTDGRSRFIHYEVQLSPCNIFYLIHPNLAFFQYDSPSTFENPRGLFCNCPCATNLFIEKSFLELSHLFMKPFYLLTMLSRRVSSISSPKLWVLLGFFHLCKFVGKGKNVEPNKHHVGYQLHQLLSEETFCFVGISPCL